MALLTEEVLEKLNSIVLLVNDKGSVEYINPYVKTVLGFSPEELLGQMWWKKTKYTSLQEKISREMISHIINNEMSVDKLVYERELNTAFGGKKWILWAATAAPDNKVLLIGNDITRRKQAELELVKANARLLRKNTDFTDSIEYAQRLQEAILPNEEIVKTKFSDFFALYLPKDTVSGDFYWSYQCAEYNFIAAIDCTGHGVPGAMLTILANSLLRDIVIRRGIYDPGTILTILDTEVQLAFTDENGHNLSNDGMDISLCRFSRTEYELAYCSAFRPIVVINSQSGTLNELSGERYPIGFYTYKDKSFETKYYELVKGETVYLFSDGYTDQFGGSDSEGKKFNKKKFKELLLSIQDMDAAEQKSFLEYVFNNWKQDMEQTDDIVVLGIKR